MFGIFRRLSELEAKVNVLERDTDPAELERLRQSVLNAIRGLRRHQQAAEAREGAQEEQEDAVGRELRLRRTGRAILPSG